LTDHDGNILQSYNYRPFGDLIEGPQTLSTNHLFTGEYLDTDLDYYYLRARYYDPTVGRFTSHDPVEDTNNKLHRYVYCGNDGVNGVDISGLSFIDIGITIALTAVSNITTGIALSPTPTPAAINITLDSLIVRPANQNNQLLAGLMFAESTSSGFSKEDLEREKLMIGFCALNRCYYAPLSPENKISFGDGTLLKAMPGFKAYKKAQWQRVMDENDMMKQKSDLVSLKPSEKRKLIDCIAAVDRSHELTIVIPYGLPLASDTGQRRYPVSMNQAIDDPPSYRQERIGRICKHTFYAFKPGYEK